MFIVWHSEDSEAPYVRRAKLRYIPSVDPFLRPHFPPPLFVFQPRLHIHANSISSLSEISGSRCDVIPDIALYPFRDSSA